MEQVRRWVRAGKISPPPLLDGREYLVDENAVRINPASPSSSQPHINSLSQRVKNGRKETKPRYSRPST
ncbi:excisionase [Leminorella grimontii]|uniref:excisionase n=1 Tax=Leminorella grimontii TaxID=82981 RepID=UPI0021C2E20F|nr:excisionase [Leminorella grimontii]